MGDYKVKLLIKLGVIVFAFTIFLPGSLQAKSVFDEVIEKNGGIIPYPFEKLMELLDKASGVRPSEARNVLLVPKGRSLQKEKADFKNPRLVYHSRSPEGMVFLGHAPTGGEVEVISWNPDLRKYEFKLIENYKEHETPQPKAIHDSTCLTCHQHGGPILSRAPWREMVNKSIFYEGKHSVIDEIKKHHPHKFHGADLDSLSTPPQDAEIRAAVLDDAVRDATNQLQAQNVCKSVCGNDTRCRGLLLQSALEALLLNQMVPTVVNSFEFRDLPNKTKGFSFPDGFEKFSLAIQKTWPKDGFGFPSSTLADRDPFVDPKKSPGFRLFLSENETHRDLTFLDEKTSRTAQRNTGPNKFLEEALKPEEVELVNPAHSRPLTRQIAAESAPYFAYGIGPFCVWPNLKQGMQDAENLKGKLNNRQEIEKVIQNPGVQKALKGTWPDIRDAVMLAILKALDIKDHKVASCYDTTKASQQLLSKSLSELIEQVPPFLEQKSMEPDATVHIKKYCGECHSSMSAMSLPLDSLKDLKGFKGKKTGKTALERILIGDMPPGYAKKKPEYKEWETDKNEIIHAIESQ